MGQAMSAQPDTPTNFEDSNAPGRKLILSVDDEPGILRSRKMILEAAGYDVVNASSGAQALGIFSTVLVDLVVLDYAMPGVNGGEVAKVFKTRRPELPILMISGRPVEREILLCVDGFLVKGEDPALMVQKIDQMLSAGSTTRLPDEIKRNAGGEQPPPLWIEFARLAATEQNPETQKALISEINRLVEKRERMMKDSASQVARTEIQRMLDANKSRPDDGPNETSSKYPASLPPISPREE